MNTANAQEYLRRLPPVDPFSLPDTDRNCPICMDPYCSSAGVSTWSQAHSTAEPGLQLPCNHCFCGACLRNWFAESNRCPLCRMTLFGVETGGMWALDAEVVWADDPLLGTEEETAQGEIPGSDSLLLTTADDDREPDLFIPDRMVEGNAGPARGPPNGWRFSRLQWPRIDDVFDPNLSQWRLREAENDEADDEESNISDTDLSVRRRSRLVRSPPSMSTRDTRPDILVPRRRSMRSVVGEQQGESNLESEDLIDLDDPPAQRISRSPPLSTPMIDSANRSSADILLPRRSEPEQTEGSEREEEVVMIWRR